MNILRKKVNILKLREYTSKIENNILKADYDKCCDDLTITNQNNTIDNPNYLRLPSLLEIKFNLQSSFENLGHMIDCEKFAESDKKTITITGDTIDKLSAVKNYSGNIYSENINLSQTDFTGVISNNTNTVQYIIGGELSASGQYVTGTGVIYTTYKNFVLTYLNSCGYSEDYIKTTFKITKDSSEDYEFNYLVSDCQRINISCPETIQNNVNIIRGNESPLSKFCQVTQVNSIEELEKYSNNTLFEFYEDY